MLKGSLVQLFSAFEQKAKPISLNYVLHLPTLEMANFDTQTAYCHAIHSTSPVFPAFCYCHLSFCQKGNGDKEEYFIGKGRGFF